MKLIQILVFFLVCPLIAFGQNDPISIERVNEKRFYISWGWNLDCYGKTDMRFKGEDFDFMLKDVKATDRQTPFALDPYFHPGKITIPQTNLRLGYFFNNRWNVSLGFDHMKYVVVQDQEVEITGQILADNEFNGTYNQDKIVLTESFLELEHTDGLNYVNIELRRFDQLLNYKLIKVNLVSGGGVGVLVPRTRTILFNSYNRDAYHLSGVGFAPLVGLNVNIGKWFFLQSELKGGYIHMPSVRISSNDMDYAAQSFLFGQFNYVFGFSRKF